MDENRWGKCYVSDISECCTNHACRIITTALVSSSSIVLDCYYDFFVRTKMKKNAEFLFIIYGHTFFILFFMVHSTTRLAFHNLWTPGDTEISMHVK